MDIQAPVHYVSMLWLIGAASGLIGLSMALWAIHRHKDRTGHVVHNEEESQWMRPDVDRYAGVRSPMHAWDPRVKIVSLLSYIFCVGALTRVGWALVALGVSLGACVLARIPLRFVVKRLAVLTGFLGMFFLVMPVTVRTLPGDVLYAFEGVEFVRINPRGLLVAALAFFKASAIMAMMVPLVGTGPFPVTIRALERLKVPSMVVQMILMCYRYLFVFTSEMQRMATAMKARGFRKRMDLRTLRTIGNFVGVLLVRSFERTERVYQAMLSRGFSGKIRTFDSLPMRKGDLWMGALWALIGFALAGLDRFVPLETLWAFIGRGG